MTQMRKISEVKLDEIKALRTAEVPGSNPGGPTIFKLALGVFLNFIRNMKVYYYQFKAYVKRLNPKHEGDAPLALNYG